MTPPAETVRQVSVGYLADLCRTGDINFRFSSRSSAIEGIAGHSKVQSSRQAHHERLGEQYHKEYPVSTKILLDSGELEVRGRIDGVVRTADGQLLLDEIKTLRVAVDDIPGGVVEGYWLQAALYGYLLLTELDATGVMLRLSLYHLDDEQETLLERHETRESLTVIFTEVLHVYLAQVEADAAWVGCRDASLADLAFPYGNYRPGQRDMAVSVFRAARAGEQLVLQAPTGIGKTMATIYPAIRSLAGSDAHRRVFYLSARTSTQAMAERASVDLSAGGARIRTVTLTAKDKVCLSPGEPCHPDHCPYAIGYFDKVREAMPRWLETRDRFDRASIEQIAREDQVCPFELSLDLARHADLVISDYNYVFDPVVYLKRFFDTGDRDSFVLVDEAHNLVDRARDMFSADLLRQPFLDLAKVTGNSLTRAAKRVNRAVLALRKEDESAWASEQRLALAEPPARLLKALAAFIEAAEPVLKEEGREPWREDLLTAYFDALRFTRTGEEMGDEYRTLLTRNGRDYRVRLFCVDPAKRLADCHARLGALVLFSATLTPRDYYGRLLGLTSDAAWYRLASPFPPENACVTIAGDIDTSYRGRSASLDELISLVHDVTRARRGNYLVFFPSYEYLAMARDAWMEQHPGIPLLCQARNLTEDERTEFLAAFEGDECLAFAVMGGIFSEGIDLAGERLIGVIVVGVGLPGLDLERDLIKAQFAECGFEYAYQYPGFTRVLQTAGRVIRSEDDRGVICLVDRRYREARYRSLIPDHWQTTCQGSAEEIREAVSRFWADQKVTLQ